MRPRSTFWLALSALAATVVWSAGPAAAETGRRPIYACDFEQDTGIFRGVAAGPGGSAQPDGAVAHAGRRSVRLVSEQDAEANTTWMRQWADGGKHRGTASLHWARHMTPDRPLVVRKGKTYEVRAFVKLQQSAGFGIALSVWGRDGSPVRGQAERYSPILSGTRDWGWVAARVACTAGDGELASVTLALLGKGTAWVDDVAITECDETAPESINAGRYPPRQLEEIRAESASCLALEFTGDLPLASAETAGNWRVRSDDDPRFTSGVRPAKVGRTRQLDNPDGTLWWADTFRHTVFLLLPQPLTSGRHYQVVMSGVGSEREEYPLAYDERDSVSRAIKVNQYGYVPGARKYAYAGGWLGTAGHLPLDAFAKEFLLVESPGGRVVFRGTPRLRMRHDQREPLSTSASGSLTGEDVYELDFSGFTTPGAYSLVVPGVGRSLPFRIAGDVYRDPFTLCARAIFHQRCGIALEEPYTTYTRGACHRGPGLEINATITDHGPEDEDELVKHDPSLKTGKTLDVWGGYHDAADYDRLIGHVRVPAVLLTLYEMFPVSFRDGQLNIPESGNGLPDLVDEARWGVDFWVRMQDPDDGGVRGGAGPNAVVTTPADRDTHPIYVYGKDPISSLSLAAVASQLARVLGDLGKPADAAFYLKRAEAAWAYGLAHGGDSYRVARALAAVELFKATGEARFHEAFLKLDPAEFSEAEQERHAGHFAWNVWLSYALCRRDGVDRAAQEVCRRRILAAADQEVRSLESFAYRMAHTGVGGAPLRYGWGCGTNVFNGGEFCVMAWRLTGQASYRDAALLAADFSLGCHPTGTVFVTGLGQRHVRWAMHTASNPMARQVGRPVKETLPGIPVFGVHAYPSSFRGWQGQLLYAYASPSAGRENFDPPPATWPDLRLYADIGWLPILSEFTVGSSMLHTTFLYGSLLTAGGAPPASR
jgi:endoglucanase